MFLKVFSRFTKVFSRITKVLCRFSKMFSRFTIVFSWFTIVFSRSKKVFSWFKVFSRFTKVYCQPAKTFSWFTKVVYPSIPGSYTLPRVMSVKIRTHQHNYRRGKKTDKQNRGRELKQAFHTNHRSKKRQMIQQDRPFSVVNKLFLIMIGRQCH